MLFRFSKPSFFRVFITILSIVVLVLAILLDNNYNITYAAPLSQLSYQGRLTNSSGTAVSDGTYEIQFSIYTQDSGGSSIWSETQNVTTQKGIFSAILGASNAINLDFNSASKYYLGIKVGTDSEMNPRSQIGAAPFAINSKYLNGAQGGTGANNLLMLNSSGEIDIAGGIKTTGILQAGTSTLSSLTVANNITLQGGTLDMQDHSITNVDTIAFNDVSGTIAGIQNQNLLDKTANETISGSWIFSNPITFSSLSLSSVTANPVLSVDNSTGTNDIVRFLDNGTAVLTIANGGLATFAGNVDATAGLDVSGAALTVASQPITQTGSGQVTFAGNVDATGGLDVTGANLTAASGEFSVDNATGSITINDGGNLGQISIESTVLDINSLDFTGAGALTVGAGTALTLTSNAAATWSTSAGLLTLQGAAGITIDSNGGNLTLDAATGSDIVMTLGGGANDDLLVDTDVLVVESDDNQVGIGTVNPGAKLEIEVDAAEGYTGLLIDQDDNQIALDINSAATSADLFNLDAVNTSGTLFDLNITAGGASTANVFDISFDNQSFSGDIFKTTIPSNAIPLQVFVIENNANSNAEGWLMEVDVNGAPTEDMININAQNANFTGNLIEIQTGNNPVPGVTGNVLYLNNLGSARMTGSILRIDDASNANASAAAVLFQLTSISDQPMLQITANAGPQAGGNLIDLDYTTVASAGNAIEIDFDAQIHTGNAIDITMNAANTGKAIIVNSGKVDFSGAGLEIPNSTDLPATCLVGEIYDDTDDNDCTDAGVGDGALCICKEVLGVNTWILLVNF